MALIYSVDGMVGKDVSAYERQTANILARKWSREHSSVDGWVKARIALVVVCSNTLLLRGSRTRYIWKLVGVDGFTAGAEGVLHEE